MEIMENNIILFTAMKRTRNNIRLAEVGLKKVRARCTIAESLLLEIDGPDCEKKADTVAEKMREMM